MSRHTYHGPFRPIIEALETRAVPSVCTVDRLSDVGEGEGLAGDLRYCLTQAQNGDSIEFAVTGTINLTRALPELIRNLRIQGPGADLLTVRRGTGDSYRIFTVASSRTVTLAGMTIQNGFASGQYGGGGIYATNADLTLADVVLSNNQAVGSGGLMQGRPGRGGGLFFGGGRLTATRTTFSGNRAIGEVPSFCLQPPAPCSAGAADGGGVYVGTGTVTLDQVTFSGNQVMGGNGGSRPTSPGSGGFGTGGGLHLGAGRATISQTTFSGNQARGGNGGHALSSAGGSGGGGVGGGLHNLNSMVTISQTTISGNQARGGTGGSGTRGGFGGSAMGGGLYPASGTMTVGHSTLAFNQVTAGAGGQPGGVPGRALGGGLYRIAGTLRTTNTILAGNVSAGEGPDLNGDLGSQGHNLIGDPTGGSGYAKTDLLGADPLLGELQDNGGSTLTHALLPGSPALDAGDNVGAPEFDQRGEGFGRVIADAIDIGAFEVQPGPATWFWLEAPAEVAAGLPFDVTLYALDDYGHLATGYEGTVTFYTTDKDPGAVLPAEYTFTADDQGLHTFAGETVLVTPGEQFLSVFDVESGAYGETAISVIPSGAPGSRGGWPRAIPYGSVVADLAFTLIRRQSRPEWFAAGLLEQMDGKH